MQDAHDPDGVMAKDRVEDEIGAAGHGDPSQSWRAARRPAKFGKVSQGSRDLLDSGDNLGRRPGTISGHVRKDARELPRGTLAELDLHGER
jgi:hypothetical protein